MTEEFSDEECAQIAKATTVAVGALTKAIKKLQRAAEADLVEPIDDAELTMALLLLAAKHAVREGSDEPVFLDCAKQAWDYVAAEDRDAEAQEVEA